MGGKTGLMYVQLVFDAFYTSYNWNRGAVFAIFMVFIMGVTVVVGLRISGTSVDEASKA